MGYSLMKWNLKDKKWTRFVKKKKKSILSISGRGNRIHGKRSMTSVKKVWRAGRRSPWGDSIKPVEERLSRVTNKGKDYTKSFVGGRRQTT